MGVLGEKTDLTPYPSSLCLLKTLDPPPHYITQRTLYILSQPPHHPNLNSFGMLNRPVNL